MGMQMPMFAAANQQATASDDVDLHDIFADYFNEDASNLNNSNADLFSNALSMAQQQQQAQQQQLAANMAVAQQQQQQMSLPTGGIKTSWHSGALPAMQQQGDSQQQPAAKRSRGEELYLPGQQQQQQQQQQQSNMGGITQQQLALAQAASGVGALSGRLGFTLPNNNGAGGINSSSMIGQQAQQQVLQTQQQVTQQGGISLPIGMGVKFNPMGNVIQHGAAGAPGMQANGNGASAGLNNGIIGNSGVMSTQGALAGNRIAVTNMQYGMNPQLQIIDKSRVEDQMAAERRLRNREHAKRSRVRKKFMLESLQQQVRGLQEENSTLRLLVQKHIPTEALKIIDECCSKSVLFGTEDGVESGTEKKEGETKNESTPLLRSDFSLIESLTSGQQNFVLSDPRLPDNPIVFASPGFYELTGYTREQVLGRNCRFLQGAGTDRKAVDVIRTAVANGTDATVCLLNYKADGTPFWNQLFVAALRDADNCIVNYVGVQTMIEPNAGASALEDKVNAAHPISVGVEDDGENKDAKE